MIGAMPEHVMIAGGGIGALEALLALQALGGDRVELSLLAPGRYVAYRALSVAEPFGGAAGPRYEWEEIAHERGVRWIPDTLSRVRAEDRALETVDGPPLRYDALLLALGARPEPALPGALTFAGPRDVLAVGDAIAKLEPGRPHRIVFAAVSGTAWTLPLYELALLTSAHGRRAGLDLAVELVTPESAPLGVFGAEASAEVARRLAQAGVRVRTGSFATEVREGVLYLELEGPLEADLVIALPALRGAAVPGLPQDERGFVAVDEHGRVRGLERVWAVGDMTTRPLKQGGLATQQADVAAADIAALAGASVDVRPYRPVLHGLLLTGAEPAFLERRPGARPASLAAAEPLWEPARKVVGHYAGPYLERLESTHKSRRRA
jgi:sulfide:quinone oxidoreductase